MATATATKEPKMATHTVDNRPSVDDFKNMSVRERIQFAKDLEAQALKDGEKLFADTMVSLTKEVAKMGRTTVEAAFALYNLMELPEQKELKMKIEPNFGKVDIIPSKPRKPRGTPSDPKVFKDADSTGARPVVGATYVLNGQVWKKQSKIGATKKEFLDAIVGGAKWEELLQK